MLARNDYRIFKALFDFNIETLEPAVMWKELADYRPSNQESRVFNRRIRDRIVDLAVLLENQLMKQSSKAIWRLSTVSTA